MIDPKAGGSELLPFKTSDWIEGAALCQTESRHSADGNPMLCRLLFYPLRPVNTYSAATLAAALTCSTIASAASRPSRIAQTTKDAPR
jgi:hypothetical protein